MPSKHPNDEVIRAWLEGKTVQYRWKEGVEWEDHNMSDYGTPNFLDQEDEGTWRIKPEIKVLWAVFIEKSQAPSAICVSKAAAESMVEKRRESSLTYTIVKMQEVEE